MKTFVQYDESGNITATVRGETPPEHPRQLEFEDYLETEGKRVNLSSLTIEDIG